MTIVDEWLRPFAGPVYFDWSTGVRHPLRGEQVIYIFEFANGVVKVGQTKDFETRCSGVRSNKRVQGNKMLRFWIVASTQALVDEQSLITFCNSLGGSAIGRTREWFTGVNVHELIALAEERFGPVDKPSTS